MELNLFMTWIIGIGVIASVIFTGIQLQQNKKNDYKKIVSKNVFVWVAEFRELMTQFLLEYNGTNDKNELKNLLFEIKLNCSNNNPDQVDLINLLTLAIEFDEYHDKISDDIIRQTDVVLDNTTRLFALEYGVTEQELQMNHQKIYDSYSPLTIRYIKKEKIKDIKKKPTSTKQ